MWFALLLLVLVVPAGCGGDVDVYGGLSERQANETVLALREAHLFADKRGEARGRTFAVVVTRAEETAALDVLRQRGLPRAAAPGETQRPGGGLLALPEELRAARAREDAAALAQTLEALPEVLEARLHLALPGEDLLPAAPGGRRPTATVVLRLRPGAVESAELLARVRLLVARAVTELRPEDVMVAAVAPPAVVVTEAAAPLRAGLLRVAPASRRLAVALQALVLLLGAALVLALGWRRRR